MKNRQRFDVLPASHDEEPELIVGTNKPDVISTGGGPQHILSGNGADVIKSGGGPDTVEAGNGKDEILAGGGPDIVDAGNGKDVLVGGGGPDDMVGGNGKDVLFGGVGPDTLTGGLGADIFVYTSAGDTSHGPGKGGEEGEEHDGEDGGPQVETITDFQPELDTIDLSQLDVVGFSDGPEGNSVWVVQDGSDAIVLIDTNGETTGEHAAELRIVLAGIDADTISAADFNFLDENFPDVPIGDPGHEDGSIAIAVSEVSFAPPADTLGLLLPDQPFAG